MPRVLEAIYEKGVLRPLEELRLAERQRVFLELHESSAEEADRRLEAWHRVYEGLSDEQIAEVEAVALASSEVREPVAAYAPVTRPPVAAPPAAAPREWPPQGEWTYDDYRRLPDDGWRYEIIRGVLHVSPAPSYRHQLMLGNLLFLLRLFLRDHPIGRVVPAPVDVILPALASPVQPDLVLIRNEQLGRIREGRIEAVPDFIVEILSPSNWLTDRREKYEAYAAAGVREYWIVDPGRSSVEVFVLEQGSYGLANEFGPGDKVRSEVFEGFGAMGEEVFAD